MKSIKKLFVIVLNLIIIGGAIYFGYQKYQEYFDNPWTRNGQVRANIIKVAPRVSGPVVYVAVVDNQFVRKGELLFQIDPTTYEKHAVTGRIIPRARQNKLERQEN